MPFRCLLAKPTSGIKCNYNYNYNYNSHVVPEMGAVCFNLTLFNAFFSSILSVQTEIHDMSIHSDHNKKLIALFLLIRGTKPLD